MDKLSVAIGAAREAGDLAAEYFASREVSFRETPDGNIKTEIDALVNDRIREILTQNDNSIHFYSEEDDGHLLNEGETWVVDPIDGTSNFCIGIPYFPVTICLIRQMTISLSVIYNPILKQMLYAQEGHGAYCDSRRIITQPKDVSRMPIISLMCGYSYRNQKSLLRKKMGFEYGRILETWAPSLDFCLLAGGKIDGIICVRGDIEDQLCGLLIAREAGACTALLNGDLFMPHSKLYLRFCRREGAESV